ncbi:uncharacterized protein (DUF1800 family) [Paraburkholderia atlantica]
MGHSPNLNAAAIALNRFGLGARADDTPPADPKGWLLAQFEQYQPRPDAWAKQPDSIALSRELLQQRMQIAQQAKQKVGEENNPNPNASNITTNIASNAAAASQTDAQAAMQSDRKAFRAEILAMYRSSVNARVASALSTQTPFIERLVHFWANHFAVSTEKPGVAALAGSFEAEAIRPHVLGRFEDMLVAVERHPAMQLFLDQTRSVGPDSMAALRAAQRNPDNRRGLNENLAREIMELHTLGVRSGYSQDDVTEFARALTGWSLAGNPGNGGANANRRAQEPSGEPGSFVFRSTLHEPGSRTIMGRRYDDAGEQQALAILHDLAHAPATAQHIGTKLARHFVADNPPAGVSVRLADAFHSQRRRSADRLSRVDRYATSVVTGRDEVQDAVGVDHFVDARTRLARPRQSAVRADPDAARPAGVAAGIARRLRRYRRELGCARCARTPCRSRATFRRARG